MSVKSIHLPVPRISHVIPLALALCALGAPGIASASAATTRFVAPSGSTGSSACTDATAPCTLPVALAASAGGDTISLADGSYDVQGIALPRVPLHWTSTNRSTRPLLTSAGNATLALTSAQTGSSFDGLEIDNTAPNGVDVSLDSDVDVALRSAVLSGAHCVSQGGGDQLEGELTIVDSRLSSPVGRTCLELPVGSVLRRSVITQTSGIATQTPPPAVETAGLVEDTNVSGGLRLVGTRAVARRVIATGSTAISGEGLVVDSLARAVGSGGAAIAADTPVGGTLRVVNATAIASSAPALEASDRVVAGSLFSEFNFLKVTNSIARGAPDLRVAPIATPCPAGKVCTEGRIVIDHSNFQSRESTRDGIPNPDLPQLGNQSGDPLFADAAGGDFHVLAGSPAIDAGDDPSGRALATDADGHARVQGAAVDIGAFEFSPPVPPPPPMAPPPGGGPGPGTGGDPPGTTTDPPRDTTAPVLSHVRLSHTRFRLGVRTTLTARTSEAGQVSIALQRRIAGSRAHPRPRFTAVGAALVRAAAKPGTVKLSFRGRIAGRRLAAGRYRFVVTAVDAAGNRSAPSAAEFTITR